MKPIAYRINSTNKSTGISLFGELKRITILTTYDFIKEELAFMNYKYPQDEHYIQYEYPNKLEIYEKNS